MREKTIAAKIQGQIPKIWLASDSGSSIAHSRESGRPAGDHSHPAVLRVRPRASGGNRLPKEVPDESQIQATYNIYIYIELGHQLVG